MAAKHNNTGEITGFFLGGIVETSKVGEVLKALFLAGATSKDIAPVLNGATAMVLPGLSHTVAALPGPGTKRKRVELDAIAGATMRAAQENNQPVRRQDMVNAVGAYASKFLKAGIENGTITKTGYDYRLSGGAPAKQTPEPSAQPGRGGENSSLSLALACVTAAHPNEIPRKDVRDYVLARRPELTAGAVDYALRTLVGKKQIKIDSVKKTVSLRGKR